MKSSHQFSDLKALYAAEKGLALRTAQLHAKNGHPDWVAFTARTAGKALKVKEPTVVMAKALAVRQEVVAEERPVVAPVAMAKSAELRTVEEHAECEAWSCFLQANDQRRIAMSNGDPMAAVGFVKIAGDALKAYHMARQKRVAADIEAGRLKPISHWHAVKAAVAKIAGLLVTLEEIAGAANPDQPLVARRAITSWKQDRFNPLVEQLIHDVDGTIASAA